MAFDLTDKARLSELVAADAVQQRGSVVEDDVVAAYSRMLDEQFSAVDRMMDLIAIDARRQADFFWEDVREPMEGQEGFCRIGTRVVYRGGYVSMQWYRNRFVKQSDGKPSKVYSTYLRKGVGDGYPLQQFKREPVWVQESVEACERNYRVLRQSASRLSQLRRTLTALKKDLVDSRR